MFGPRPEEEFLTDASRAARFATGRGDWLLLLAIVLGIGAFLLWASWFEIDEVTRGEGRVVPSRQMQIVQSLEPAIIRSIEVAEGDLVEPGQALLQIDDTAAAADRGELREREAALEAEEIRLRAEIVLDRQPVFPEDLTRRAPDAVLAEMEVLQARFAQLDGEIAVREERLSQKRAALQELLAQRTKQEAVAAPLREEVALSRDLAARGAVPRIELLRLESRLAELEGDIAVGRAQEANFRAAIREAEGEIDLARSGYLLTARQRLATLGVELAVVREALHAADERVGRTQLASPVRGIVNAVNVTTVGEVVEPGRPLVEIVPVDDSLQIEVNVLPRDVAFIRPGEKASVKITAYDYLVYGALEGEVVRIGADTTRDGEGREFFRVTIRTDRTDLGKDGQALPVTPGMRATVDIQTGRRTVLSYLMAPVLRIRSEAFRER